MKPSQGGPGIASATNQARTAPSMKNSPWATLTTRITPKTRLRPEAVSARTSAITRPSIVARSRNGPKSKSGASWGGDAPRRDQKGIDV